MSVGSSSSLQRQALEPTGFFGTADLLVEILLCLPPKPLLRCRSVCKSWRALLSSDEFVELHRESRSRRRAQVVLLYPRLALDETKPEEEEKFYFVEPPWPLRQEGSAVAAPLFSGSRVLSVPCDFMMNSQLHTRPCRGLWLLYAYEPAWSLSSPEQGRILEGISHGILIINPTTQEKMILPRPSACKPPVGDPGFGYVSSTKEYKVVFITFHPGICAEVLTLVHRGREGNRQGAGRSWRTISAADLPVRVLSSLEVQPVLLHETIYWLCYCGSLDSRENKAICILCFDLKEERFRVINLPHHIRTKCPFNLIMQLDGRVGLAMLSEERIEVWISESAAPVLSSSSGEEAWSMLCCIEHQGHPVLTAVTDMGDGKILTSSCLNLGLIDVKKRSFQAVLRPGDLFRLNSEAYRSCRANNMNREHLNSKVEESRDRDEKDKYLNREESGEREESMDGGQEELVNLWPKYGIVDAADCPLQFTFYEESLVSLH